MTIASFPVRANRTVATSATESFSVLATDTATYTGTTDHENRTVARGHDEMSRSGYSNNYEYLYLWRSNVDRAIAGKRGQAFLQELVTALEAMPEKRLIRHSLEESGQVCAIGAVGLKRGVDMKRLDPEEPEQVGKAFGISTILAQEIVYENDERHYSQTPEERWDRMHGWAKSHLKTESRYEATK
jgi:hypothetical protein